MVIKSVVRLPLIFSFFSPPFSSRIALFVGKVLQHVYACVLVRGAWCVVRGAWCVEWCVSSNHQCDSLFQFNLSDSSPPLKTFINNGTILPAANIDK